jgi:hypothetical protein
MKKYIFLLCLPLTLIASSTPQSPTKFAMVVVHQAKRYQAPQSRHLQLKEKALRNNLLDDDDDDDKLQENESSPSCFCAWFCCKKKKPTITSTLLLDSSDDEEDQIIEQFNPIREDIMMRTVQNT